MKVTRKEGPGKKIFANLMKQAGAKVAQVGFFPSAHYEDGTPVAEVAAKQEYGDPSNTLDGRPAPIPPRPFMRPTFDEKKDNWQEFIENGVKEIANGTATSIEQVLGGVGLQAQGDVVTTIKKVTEPPLSEYTLKMRRERPVKPTTSTQPLHDTGTMIGEVTHAVVDASEAGGGE